MNLDDRTELFKEGLQCGLEASISRAEKVAHTFEVALDPGCPGCEDGAREVVDELKKLKEVLNG